MSKTPPCRPPSFRLEAIAVTMIPSTKILTARHATFCLFAMAMVSVHGLRLLRRILNLNRRQRLPGTLRMLVVGTFYNQNWFRSHIMPLSRCSAVARIEVITDAPLFAVEKVKYICPSARMARLLGRPLSRAILVVSAALRSDPDMLMGYHIMPNALLCLVAAALSGGQAAYQMTGGPIQIIGGGVGSENALLRHLKRPSRVLESMLYHLVRQFDLLVVRGGLAARFVREHRLARRVEIISGSVDESSFHPNGHAKCYDLVLVARHIKEKQPHFFIETVAALHRVGRPVRAVLVGEGPLTESLKMLVRELGIQEEVIFLGNVDNVSETLSASRIFLLTSKTEGLSIAVVEAMAAGLPVLAPNVGELGEMIRSGENGFFIEPSNVDETASRVIEILSDSLFMARMSGAARRVALEQNSVPAMAVRWDRILGQPHHVAGA